MGDIVVSGQFMVNCFIIPKRIDLGVLITYVMGG
jgi:hypothetical protein